MIHWFALVAITMGLSLFGFDHASSMIIGLLFVISFMLGDILKENKK